MPSCLSEESLKSLDVPCLTREQVPNSSCAMREELLKYLQGYVRACYFSVERNDEHAENARVRHPARRVARDRRREVHAELADVAVQLLRPGPELRQRLLRGGAAGEVPCQRGRQGVERDPVGLGLRR